MKAEGHSLVLGSRHEKLAEVMATVPRKEAATAPRSSWLGTEPILLSATQHKCKHLCKGLFSDLNDDQNTLMLKRFFFYDLLSYEVLPQT